MSPQGDFARPQRQRFGRSCMSAAIYSPVSLSEACSAVGRPAASGKSGAAVSPGLTKILTLSGFVSYDY